MLGAIIGDIVGSRFEFNNHRSKDFELFTDECFVTDNSIMTIAVSKAIIETEKSIEPTINGFDFDEDYYSILEEMTVKYMQEIGRKYPDCGYGGMFAKWMFSENPKPYNSFGNGAAMRISPAGFVARDESEAIDISETITSVTHNHDEGIKGAAATAVAIFMASHGYLKSEIKEKIINEYYPIDFTIDEIRPNYHFNETCQGTVPQALECFFESESFEDAIRIAISLGGDSDTIGAITGSIAEAYYGIPEEIQSSALKYLDDYLISIYSEWVTFNGKDTENFKILTKYIGKITAINTYNDSINEMYKGKMLDHQLELQFWDLADIIRSFEKEFYQLLECHPEYMPKPYAQTLEDNGLKWEQNSLQGADCEALDAKAILALLFAAIRAEHFSDGALRKFFYDGHIVRWLKRLKDIEWQNMGKKVSEIYFQIGGFQGYESYQILFADNRSFFLSRKTVENQHKVKRNSIIATEKLISDWNNLHTEYWKYDYPQEREIRILDGTQWSLLVRYEGCHSLIYGGDNTYPESWNELLELLEIGYDEDDDYDDYNDKKPKRKSGEFIYCSVSFSKSAPTYYYLTEDENIEVGDRVIVPVGPDNHERIAVVNEVEYFARDNVPFPLDKVKHIIRKCTDADFEERVLLNNNEES